MESRQAGMTGRLLSFPTRQAVSAGAEQSADEILSLSAEERVGRSRELRIDDPETLLALCGRLRSALDTNPAKVKADAEMLFGYICEPKRQIGLFDEREYFLGELALLAGSASRALALRSEAARWFDRAEGNFRLTVNAVADWSRVSYQRLAMLLEERKLDDLLEQLPTLEECFDKLDMREDLLKCRSLHGLALMERGDLVEAGRTFNEIRQSAAKLGSERVLASSYVNLIHICSLQGDEASAVEYSTQALPLIRKLGHNIAFAQVQLGIGSLLRTKGQTASAIDAYQRAQAEFETLGMSADVAATRLIIADLLLDAGQEEHAALEVTAALPTIGEYRMVPEGMAALALLRESLRHQKVNHQALRDLHGYFEDSVQ